MRISRWSRTVAAGVGGVVLTAAATTVSAASAAEPVSVRGAAESGPDATTGGANTSVPARSGAGWTAADAEQFWTAARMEAATPPPASGGAQPGKGNAGEGGKADTEKTDTEKAAGAEKEKRSVRVSGVALFSSSTAASSPSTVSPSVSAYSASASSKPYAKGAKTVGVLYYVEKGLKAHSCTASVVHSPKGNLILTAGHCGNGSKYAFVPQYRTGKTAAQQPNGIWAVDRVFKDPRRTDTGPGSDLDFAFATVKPDERGRQVEQITGANKLTRTPGYRAAVTVIGYPKATYVAKDQAIRCAARTTRLTGYKQLRMECGGFHGGTSGSPWLMNFDEKSQTGDVVGNLGGYGGGGSSHSVSYSPYYDDEVFKLYDDAVDNVAAVRRPPLPRSLGTGETWQHAKQLASGDYTGDGKADLLVVWTDGEVTLHPGDGKGGFGAERRLKAPNGTWKHATTITGGDFTGTGRSDLMVRWSDGEVTLYADVSPSGLGKETKLAKAKSVWKHASQITAGRFSGNKRTDDVLVRWSDGEITLYRDVNGRGFKKETRLRKPTATWKRATLLTSGDFTGNGNWDVIVRWSDGKRTLYRDVSAAGIGKKTQMQAPNALWKHAKVMTAGNYTANGRPDDLIVRWGDGELSLYADSGTKLGAERTLVPPKTK